MTTKARAAYDESVRAIASQEAAVAELRSRTSVVFAAATLSVSLVGTTAIEDGWGIPEWIGAAALAFMALAVATILWPRSWRFPSNGVKLVANWVDDPKEELDDMYRDLAIWITRMRLQNQDRLNRLMQVSTRCMISTPRLGALLAGRHSLARILAQVSALRWALRSDRRDDPALTASFAGLESGDTRSDRDLMAVDRGDIVRQQKAPEQRTHRIGW